MSTTATRLDQDTAKADGALTILRAARERIHRTAGCADFVAIIDAAEIGDPEFRIDQLRMIAGNLRRVSARLSTYTWEEDAYILTRDIHVGLDKAQQVTLTVSEITFDVSRSGFVENAAAVRATRTFLLRRHRALVPEIGAGLVIARVRQPKFGTGVNDAGETILTRADDEEWSLDAALMLNLVCGCRMVGTYPMLQFGVSVDRQRPAFLAGAGFRFAGSALKHVAFGFGGVLAFPRDLTNLSVGDRITGTTDIEEDLDFKPTVKAYFTLQYTFK